MDLNVYNISYIVGLFGEPNQAKYTANMERGIDTSGILTMDYNSFRAVCMAAGTAVLPPGTSSKVRRGYIFAEIHRQLVRRRHLPPERGAGEEHFNLNGGRPVRRRRSSHAFCQGHRGR